MGAMSRESCGVYDPAIPHLGALTRALDAAQLLSGVAMLRSHRWMATGEGSLEVQAVTVLRGHPGSRWTLRYDVRRGNERRTLIAKVYARDRGDVAAMLLALRRGGFGPGERMQVAVPIAYLPAPRLLLLEEAPGLSARAVLSLGQAGVGEEVARWLAAFQAASPPLPGAYRLRDPLVKARRWTRALGGDAPMLAGAARHLLDALAAAQPAWPAAPHLMHGDFGVSHVYLAAGTTTVIDWDTWGVGDCAEDAGRFLASLHHIAARSPAQGVAVAREAELFARTYRSEAPLAGRRLAFYCALACLRKASRLMAAGKPGRMPGAAVLLATGERALRAGSA